MQLAYASGLYYAPVNQTVQLTPKVAAKVHPNAEEQRNLQSVPWDKISAHESELSDRWNRESPGASGTRDAVNAVLRTGGGPRSEEAHQGAARPYTGAEARDEPRAASSVFAPRACRSQASIYSRVELTHITRSGAY